MVSGAWLPRRPQRPRLVGVVSEEPPVRHSLLLHPLHLRGRLAERRSLVADAGPKSRARTRLHAEPRRSATVAGCSQPAEGSAARLLDGVRAFSAGYVF